MNKLLFAYIQQHKSDFLNKELVKYFIVIHNSANSFVFLLLLRVLVAVPFAHTFLVLSIVCRTMKESFETCLDFKT